MNDIDAVLARCFASPLAASYLLPAPKARAVGFGRFCNAGESHEGLDPLFLRGRRLLEGIQTLNHVALVELGVIQSLPVGILQPLGLVNIRNQLQLLPVRQQIFHPICVQGLRAEALGGGRSVSGRG